MLTITIFSKDRPLQLCLTLDSIIKNLSIDHHINVIYQCSSVKYEKAYDRLIHEYKDCLFLDDCEFSFGPAVISTLNNSRPFYTFLTDDNIVYRKSKITDLDLSKIFADEVACLSMRLGMNITKRDDEDYPLPHIQKYVGNYLVWNRMSALAGSYWNYPLSVDGHIFETKTMTKIVKDLFKHKDIGNPNQFEQYLQRYFFEIPALMCCEVYSTVVNSPNNRVQDECKNWFGKKYPLSQDYLLDKFNAGGRINLDEIEFNVISPHQEIDITKGLYV